MKKTAAILLALVLCMGILTGCKSAAASSAAPASASGEKSVTLRFLSWQTTYKDRDAAVAKAYHEKHPNINVTYEYIGDMDSYAYLEKVDVMMMGGEEADIIMTNTATTMSSRASSGLYLSMDKMLSAEGIKAEEFYNGVVKINNSVYSLPIDESRSIVLLNKDMLDQAGLSKPASDWTWDDYRTYAKQLTHGDGAQKVYGSHFHSWSSYNYLGMNSAKQDNPLFVDPKTTSFDNPNFAAFLQLRSDMENVDHCQTPLSEVKSLNMNYRDVYFNQKAAMFPTYTYMVAEIGNQTKYPHSFVTTFAPWPVFGADGVPGRSDTVATQVCIAKTSKHAQEAYDYLRYLTTEGVQMRGVGFSAVKGADQSAIVNIMIGGEENKKYYDLDALTAVLNDPNYKANGPTFAPKCYDAMDTMVGEECDKYLLGSSTLDECIANMKKRGNELIAES